MNKILIEQIKAVYDPTLPDISNISNLLALCFYEYEEVNWFGLYYCDHQKEECTLGPFQGKVACTRIPFSKGVIGKTIQDSQTTIVNDVHQFQNHIACDSSTNSEMVIPLYDSNHQIVAVLDIDSLSLNYFDKDKTDTFESVASFFTKLVSNHKL